MTAVIRIRLNAYAVGASEGIEVIDIKGTQIDLQGFKNIRDSNAKLTRFHTIEIGIKLWYVDLVARIKTGQFRCLIGLSKKRLRRIIQCPEAKPITVLKLKLETASRTQSLNRWRREHGDEGILNGTKLLVKLHGDGIGRKIRCLAFLERLQGYENNTGVRGVGETIDRQAGEGDSIRDTWLLERYVGHATDHVFRAVERCRIGQLREADQILLVLCWNETAGYCAKQNEGNAQQDDIKPHHQRLARKNAANAATIDV